MSSSLLLLASLAFCHEPTVPVDLKGYDPACGVMIHADATRVVVRWPIDGPRFGGLVLNLTPGRPLIEGLGLTRPVTGLATSLLQDVEPVTFLTVGSRQAPAGRPPGMPVWNVFFDKPATRPHRTYRSQLALKHVRVTSEGRRATVTLGDLTIGPFTGELAFTCYAGCDLLHVEAVVRTEEDGHAILYDAGLVGTTPSWNQIAWLDTEGRLHRAAVDTPDHGLAVRHRTVCAESDAGTVACFPPPHQYQFPRDWTDNLGFVWAGRGHHGLETRPGFGVRQVADGKRAFEPWFNAPPGTEQRLGVFYLLSPGMAEDALRQTLRYTHGDRFEPVPGHITFTTHWHMAVGVAGLKSKHQGTPDFVRIFKDMGVQAVHLADFHGDGHPQDPGPLRLQELDSLFTECRRLSDDKLLLMPGEEANQFLGIREPGKHPGHWMLLFPKPVYWIMQHPAGLPAAEQQPPYGTVYRIGDQREMMDLIEKEHGLAWTAHPRIKASSWTPDIFRREAFYTADYWLGAAWKAMPADLSRPRLGERGLDLLDDMANWGPKKYLPGEVDVFQIDHTHELYGHMNVNYLRLDRLPRFEDGWQSILDTLRAGRFFVTTGEVLLHDFTVSGKGSGATVKLPDGRAEIKADVGWTFPLRFAELISGDGRKVYHERIPLTDTGPFGRRTLTLRPDLRGRKWVRLEVSDVAANGAFTQPVWIE